MGRGGDLTSQERAFVHNKVMQNWDSEKRQIKVGGREKIIKACIKGGVRVAAATEEASFASRTTSVLSWWTKVGFILRPMLLRLCS
jgi:succinyl-CoA synthetase beta subunit